MVLECLDFPAVVARQVLPGGNVYAGKMTTVRMMRERTMKPTRTRTLKSD
jgi:hypothetical protein